MNGRGRYFVLSLGVAITLLAPLYAQKTTGTIRGVVSDPSEAVVPTLQLVIDNDATSTELWCFERHQVTGVELGRDHKAPTITELYLNR